MYEDFKKLLVWQKAHEVSLAVYRITVGFPKHEQYCLTQQMRRAAISVPCNVVEGRARGSKKEYIRFLHIARGSLEEVRYQLLLARDLGYVDKNTYQEVFNMMDEVGKLLYGLMSKLLQ